MKTTVLLATVFVLVMTYGATFARAQQAPASPAPKTSTTSQPAATPTETVNEISFITSPPRVELKGKPGDTLQTQVKIKNVTNTEETYSTSAVDFIVAEDGFTPIPVTEKVSGRWSAASWMTLTPPSSRIAKNDEKTVDVIVQIPSDALPGGHYAMITHSLNQSTEQTRVGQTNGSAAFVTPRVGTLVYITVEGDIHEEAFVRDFRGPKWVEFGPVDFKFTVENQSDVHIRPVSTITVKNIFGFTKQVIEVPSNNIFPLSNREFEASWDTFWGFGPYTATLNVAYGTQGHTFQTSTMVWIIPYRVLLSILVVVFALLAIYISVRRHIIHRYDLKAKQIEVLEEKVKALESELKQ